MQHKKAILAGAGVVLVGAVLFSRRASASDTASDTAPQQPAKQENSMAEKLTEQTGTPAAKVPRGIRNNNPLNIEFNTRNQWEGQTGHDGRFIIFKTPYHGIRAAGRLLRTYRLQYGLVTPRGIINRWAPAADGNNVGAYLDHIAKRAGLFADLQLVNSDYPKLVETMIQHENGQQPYDMNLITMAVTDGLK